MRKDIVFVSKFSSVKLDKKSDIVLSPEFYWVIKRKLPVQSVREAKKLCNSLFDGILPNGEYSYKVIKEGDTFFIFAYDSNYIIESLKSIGVELTKISGVYLAQNELLEGVSYRLGDRAYISQGGVWISLPMSLVDKETKDIKEIEFTKLSGIKISLERYDTLIDGKSLNIIMIITMVFITLNLPELFLYKRELDGTVHSKELLYKKYHLPKTSWQINAIKDKVHKTFKNEVALRDEIYHILKTPLSKGSYIKNMEIRSNIAKIQIKLDSNSDAKRIKSWLMKYFDIDRAIVKDGVLKMELRYAKN